MKFHQLLYFLETAKHEHIGRAAKVLAISPSAISHSIAALESELGRELFNKQGKNIFLTNHGRILYEKVSKLLNEVDSIKEEILSDQIELQGTYRLAASHLLSHSLLAPAWSGVQNQNPKLFAEIYSLRSAQVVEGVSSGSYDFGVCFSPQSHPSLQREVLYEGQLVIAVNAKHPLLKLKKTERLKRLAEFKATLPKSYQGIDNCETHPIFEKFNIRPKVDLIFDNYEVAMAKVANSDAWGFFPDWILTKCSARLVPIIPEGWDASMNISVIYPSNRIVTKVLRVLIGELKTRVS